MSTIIIITPPPPPPQDPARTSGDPDMTVKVKLDGHGSIADQLRAAADVLDGAS